LVATVARGKEFLAVLPPQWLKPVLKSKSSSPPKGNCQFLFPRNPEARVVLNVLRRAEAPPFHVTADILECFRWTIWELGAGRAS
jgi:hypothetical protein